MKEEEVKKDFKADETEARALLRLCAGDVVSCNVKTEFRYTIPSAQLYERINAKFGNIARPLPTVVCRWEKKSYSGQRLDSMAEENEIVFFKVLEVD